MQGNLSRLLRSRFYIRVVLSLPQARENASKAEGKGAIYYVEACLPLCSLPGTVVQAGSKGQFGRPIHQHDAERCPGALINALLKTSESVLHCLVRGDDPIPGTTSIN